MLIENVCILVGIFFVFLGMNHMIKQTVAYKNKFCFAQNFMVEIPDEIQMAVIGSTYSIFAAQALEDIKENVYNMGGFSRPIKYDYLILKDYIGKFAEGSRIILFLGICVCLCSSDFEDTSGSHYAILEFSEMNKPSIRLWCAYHFPIFQFRKYLKSDEKTKLTIDEKYRKMVGEDINEKLIVNRVNTWIRQFSLSNLVDIDINNESQVAIEKNIHYLEMIRDLCKKSGLDLAVVIPPFSEYLNKYIGGEFIERVLYEPIENTFEEKQIYDYRKHPAFQKQSALFLDGGFLLNYDGSYKFCHLLLDEMKERDR